MASPTAESALVAWVSYRAHTQGYVNSNTAPCVETGPPPTFGLNALPTLSRRVADENDLTMRPGGYDDTYAPACFLSSTRTRQRSYHPHLLAVYAVHVDMV